MCQRALPGLHAKHCGPEWNPYYLCIDCWDMRAGKKRPPFATQCGLDIDDQVRKQRMHSGNSPIHSDPCPPNIDANMQAGFAAWRSAGGVGDNYNPNAPKGTIKQGPDGIWRKTLDDGTVHVYGASPAELVQGADGVYEPGAD